MNFQSQTLFHLFVIAFFACIFNSCQEEVYTPKPRAYFRLTVSDTTYTVYEGNEPFSFEYSLAALPDKIHPANSSHWLNFVYPKQNAVIFTDYISLDTAKLTDLISDTRSIVLKQMVKADDMIQSEIIDTAAHIFGQIYETIGNNAACPFQFWLTDEKNYFFRASFYLNNVPQNDSLAPIITHLKKDMLHIIKTFQWKKNK